MSITNLLPHLPPFIAQHSLDDLRKALPLPIPDTPETREARDRAAFAAVAALRPADAADAMMAVSIVLAQAHAADSMRLAHETRDPRQAERWRALSRQSMNNVRAGLRLLEKIQASRRKQAVQRQAQAPRPDTALCHAPLPENPPRQPPPARPGDTARAERESRLRALDLRTIETPSTRH
jgi:hypothetical protein